MPLDYATLMALPPREIRASYAQRDTMLYALGIGFGSDTPCAASDLRFVYEQDLVCFPTMAVVIGGFGFWMQNPQYGIEWRKVLHGEQSLEIHRPMPVEGEVTSVLTIDEIYDKGVGKGAVLYSTRKLLDARDRSPLATLRQCSFLRGDGGCGGRQHPAPRPHPVPDHRQPDHVVELRTRIDQALLYRLSGDYNPLHADPLVASAAGFERPILHGLCSYGVIGRAVVAALCGGQVEALRRFDVRFVLPVFPGETLRTEIWSEASGRAAFRTLVTERNVVAVDNGFVEFATDEVREPQHRA